MEVFLLSILSLPGGVDNIRHIHKCDACGVMMGYHYSFPENSREVACNYDGDRELCDYCLDDEYEEQPDITPQSCGIEI